MPELKTLDFTADMVITEQICEICQIFGHFLQSESLNQF